MQLYSVTLNGKHYRHCDDSDHAETIAETLWMTGRGETQVIAPDGSIVCEFEV